MWYKFAKKNKGYTSVLHKLLSPVKQFSTDDENSLDPEIAKELLPEDIQQQETPQAIETPDEPAQAPAEENPILIDPVEPSKPVSVDKIEMNPPVSPHDGCRCVKRVKKTLSGAFVWEIDSSMCPVCKNAAQDYNNKSMDAAGVNDPLYIQ